MSEGAHRSQGPRTSSARKVETQDERKRYLIVCEGEKTEPLYFQAFPVAGVVLDVKGTGHNTLSLVDEAVRLRDLEDGDYDQCWCVFDRDSFAVSDFNNAVAMAEASGFHVAFSNQAFELWYLLHFNYHDVPLDRASYKTRLSKCMGKPYAKNDPLVYRQLLPRQSAALRNARRLHATHEHSTPEQCSPCTTVYKLVEELNANIPPGTNTP